MHVPRRVRWCSLVCLALLSGFSIVSAQPPGQAPPAARTIDIAPGFEALRGQTTFDLRLSAADDVAARISVESLEAAASAQLRQAGITVSKWTTRDTARPVLWIWIDGGTLGPERLLVYSVFLEYYALLEVPGFPGNRLIKGGVYNTGFDGITPVETAATSVTRSMAGSIESFLKNAYLQVNPSSQPAPPTPPSTQVILDSGDAMQGYSAGPRAVAFQIQVGRGMPVSESSVQATVERTLAQSGVKPTAEATVGMPMVRVSVDGLTTKTGRFVYSVLVRYTRVLGLPQRSGGSKLIRADIHRANPSVGAGNEDFAASDIISTVDLRVKEAIQPHLQANAATPEPGPDSDALICTSPTAGFLPVPFRVIDQLLTFAQVTPRDVVYDVGWGDSGVALAAAKAGARAVAFPLCPLGLSVATRTLRAANVGDRAKVAGHDLWTADFSDATVVVLHLLPTLNQKLLSKLARELKPGARIISLTFNMGECYPPQQTVQIPGGSKLFSVLYSWTVPVKDTCSPGGAVREQW